MESVSVLKDAITALTDVLLPSHSAQTFGQHRR